MSAYESPVSYKLIYVFRVPYEDHAGLLKIGDATIKTSASAAQLTPNCDFLNFAARCVVATQLSSWQHGNGITIRNSMKQRFKDLCSTPKHRSLL